MLAGAGSAHHAIDPPDERVEGTTVAEARGFARKAATILLLVPVGGHRATFLRTSKVSFLDALRGRRREEPMPCTYELRHGQTWLYVGTHADIETWKAGGS